MMSPTSYLSGVDYQTIYDALPLLARLCGHPPSSYRCCLEYTLSPSVAMCSQCRVRVEPCLNSCVAYASFLHSYV